MKAINHAQRRMINHINDSARVNGKLVQPVLDAMLATDRRLFVDPVWQFQAYEEKTLPIGGLHQTISLPSVVCHMSALLFHYCQHQTILEVGTGSGYQSAILSKLWQQVYTIERVPLLSTKAHQTHRQLRLTNIHYAVGDGCLGWQPAMEFDAILVTAQLAKPPQALLSQLKIGSYLLAPIGSIDKQYLTLYKRQGLQRFASRTLIETQFVPMIQGIAS